MNLLNDWKGCNFVSRFSSIFQNVFNDQRYLFLMIWRETKAQSLLKNLFKAFFVTQKVAFITL